MPRAVVLKCDSLFGGHLLTLPSPTIPSLFLFVLQILFYFDIVFTTIFTIEIALKVKP